MAKRKSSSFTLTVSQMREKVEHSHSVGIARVRRLYGLVYPRNTLPVRMVVNVMNRLVWRGPVHARDLIRQRRHALQQSARLLAQLALWLTRHDDGGLRLDEQVERYGCDRGGGPLSSRSTLLSVPADRRGCGTAHVGTPRRGRSHACTTNQRARTPTKMSQSMLRSSAPTCRSHTERNGFGALEGSP